MYNNSFVMYPTYDSSANTSASSGNNENASGSNTSYSSDSSGYSIPPQIPYMMPPQQAVAPLGHESQMMSMWPGYGQALMAPSTYNNSLPQMENCDFAAYNNFYGNLAYQSQNVCVDNGSAVAVKHSALQIAKPDEKNVVFGTVVGRLSLFGGHKYTVKLAEMKRRLGKPEMLNQSILSGILRKAKNKDGGEALTSKLAEHGITLQQGRRKNVEINAFTSLCEGEAQQLVRDYGTVANNYYPRRGIAYEVLSKTSSAEECRAKHEQYKTALNVINEILGIMNQDVSPVCDQPTDVPSQLHPETQKEFTDFSLMTHGFGPGIQRQALLTVNNAIVESMKALYNPKEFLEGMPRGTVLHPSMPASSIPVSSMPIPPMPLLEMKRTGNQKLKMTREKYNPR